MLTFVYHSATSSEYLLESLLAEVRKLKKGFAKAYQLASELESSEHVGIFLRDNSEVPNETSREFEQFRKALNKDRLPVKSTVLLKQLLDKDSAQK